MSQAQPVRFPILTPEEMSPRQKEVSAAIAGGPRGGIRGPFLALIHNPELANRVQQLGEHLRYGNTLSLAHIELIVLTVARHWNCQYEWFAHERIARSTTDLADGIIKALALGQTPPNMTAEQNTSRQVFWSRGRVGCLGTDGLLQHGGNVLEHRKDSVARWHPHPAATFKQIRLSKTNAGLTSLMASSTTNLVIWGHLIEA